MELVSSVMSAAVYLRLDYVELEQLWEKLIKSRNTCTSVQQRFRKSSENHVVFANNAVEMGTQLTDKLRSGANLISSTYKLS